MNLYPDISWTQFRQCCTGDPREQFEEMTRRLFINKFLGGKEIPSSLTSHPGIEVDPILEGEHDDGSPRKLISFQSKFFDNKVDYNQIKSSSEVAVKHYKGKLDRIYLFCNMTINPNLSSTYQATEKLLNDAGIELVPISNDGILDLVFNQKNIAEYYFQPRNRTYMYNGVVELTTIHPTGVTGGPERQEQLPNIESELYKRLLSEKINICKASIIDYKFTQLRNELKNLEGVEEDCLQFYRFLLAIVDERIDEARQYKETIKDPFRCDAEWLYSLVIKPRIIEYHELSSHMAEGQAVALNVLLTNQHFNCIISIHEKGNDSVIRKTINFCDAISMYNLHRLDEAKTIFADLYSSYHEPDYRFFYLCADLQIKNIEYGIGTKERADNIKNNLDELLGLRNTAIEAYRHNERLVAILEIQSYYNMCSIDNVYLERAYTAYNNYPDTVKNDTQVMYLIGACYELSGKCEEAIDFYSSCNWTEDENIAYRLISCLIRQNCIEEASDMLKQVKVSGAPIEALNLHVQYRTGSKQYVSSLKKAITKHTNSFDDLLVIMYYIEDPAAFTECVNGLLTEKIENDIDTLGESKRNALLLTLVRNKQIDLIYLLLYSIMDSTQLDNSVAYQVYLMLFDIANKASKNEKAENRLSHELKVVERISDIFIDHNKCLKYFLQVKIVCLSVNERNYAMLEYYKRLYDLTGDIEIANNIVVLLASQGERSPNEYEQFISALKQSYKPSHALTVCSGAVKLNDCETAEKYAYKALYLLNGEDDYEIFKGYFSYASTCILSDNSYCAPKHVTDKSVVEIVNNYDNTIKHTICMDTEADFNDEDNHSLGIEHLHNGDSNYTKLLHVAIGQVVKVFDSHYKVLSVVPRNVYALRYINSKIQEHPEEFDGVVYMVSTRDTQQFTEDIKKYIDSDNGNDFLLRCYHFDEIEIGLPIDMVVRGDYSRYVDVFKFLLYGKDQALYAGDGLDELDKCYVPTLSTFVLLSITGHLDLLDVIKEKAEILIPESYILFLENQYRLSIDLLRTSPGKLTIDSGGNLVTVEHDKHIPEIWEEILGCCKNCSCEKITNQERADYKFSDEISLEQIVSMMEMDKIQLDALILSKREHATYLSDDLFLRKVAMCAGVKNNNSTFIIKTILNSEEADIINLELSKTNYIYLPMIMHNQDRVSEFENNLMAGERKHKIYGSLFDSMRRRITNHINNENEE